MFDPSAHGFFDREAVDEELRRVAGICQGCRRCYDLCPSFDVLFRALDRPQVDGDANRLLPGDVRAFSDLCYECRLCTPHCPYYPPHRSDVDVPRLVFRDRASRVRNEGKPPLRDRVLSATDAVGRIATALAPLVNSVGESRIARVLLEKTLGVHRDRLLPTYAGESFREWWKRRDGQTRPDPDAPARDRVALFVTCFLNDNSPEVARAVVAVLEKNGCRVAVPEQRCCGMPWLENGDLDSARECRTENVRTLLPFVRAGYTVVAAGPTCSLTIREEYPALGDEEGAEAVAAATRDACEYLMERHSERGLSLDFARSPGRVLYQAPCHLRVQDVGWTSRDLLRLIPGAEVRTVERCAGHDGTWSMKTEYFPISMEVGKPLFEQVQSQRPDTVATDCPLAALQIRQGTGRSAKHPLQVFADAYGLSYEE
jgi:glycerol-3-phosphate dehydrogenase subunit C